MGQLAFGLPAPLDTWPGQLAAAAIVSMVTWWALFPLRETLKERGLLDFPNERSLHSDPTPRGGGLAIAACVLLSLCGLAFFGHDLWVAMRPYVIGAALMAAIGWADDRWSLAVTQRLLGQLVAAGIFVWSAGYPTSLSLPGVDGLPVGVWGAAITVLWIIGLTNAYNFMDGIDGIAAGQALVAGSLWFIAGWQSGLMLVGAIGLLIAAGSWAFLPHNWPPARVFLGDIGSYFLGFSFAALPLMALAADPDGPWFSFGALAVGPFLFDSVATFLRRLASGQNVFRAHRSHFYQRLVQAGFTVPAVTALYVGLALLCGVAGMALLIS